jgi:site-specific DNA-methyltransferase (adenine-specific)
MLAETGAVRGADLMKSAAFCTDCMEFMRTLPDKSFSLAVVDTPYGIIGGNGGDGGENGSFVRPHRFDTGAGKLRNRALNTMRCDWDSTPPGEDYFRELFRVSKNQIIFGGNYFRPPPCRCFIVWNKMQPWENFSQAEYAWTSFDRPSKVFSISCTGAGGRAEQKIHPTQKPVSLYRDIFSRFAEPGDTVLDTHLGSGSSRIAAWEAGLDFTGTEISRDYFDDEEKRFSVFRKTSDMQPSLFSSPEPEKVPKILSFSYAGSAEPERSI